MSEEEMEDGTQSVDNLSSTPTGVETPDVIDLRKQQRKEPKKPLYQVLEEKEEKIAPGTLLGTTHTYMLGDKDKSAAKRVDLQGGQKSDKVDATIHPEELEVMDDVLVANTKKQEKRRCCGTKRRTSATWLQRLKRNESVRCKIRKEKRKRKISSFRRSRYVMVLSRKLFLPARLSPECRSSNILMDAKQTWLFVMVLLMNYKAWFISRMLVGYVMSSWFLWMHCQSSICFPQ